MARTRATPRSPKSTAKERRAARRAEQFKDHQPGQSQEHVPDHALQPVAPTRAAKAPIEPQTENQTILHNAMYDPDIAQVFVFGPPGTGKTYVTTGVASQLLVERRVKKIVISRPNVPAGPTLGLMPGTYDEKVAPWAAPVMEVLNERLGSGHVEYLLKVKVIEFVAFETMRGRTFNNAVVILDEAQNATPEQMRMFNTRLGRNSLAVVNGDIAQSDLQHGAWSGLADALELVEFNHIPAKVVEFTLDDIVRSDICAMWARAYWKRDRARIRSAKQGGATADLDYADRVDPGDPDQV